MAYLYNPNNVCIVPHSKFPVRCTAPSPNFPDKFVLAEGDSWFHIGGLTKLGNTRNLIDKIAIENKHTLLVNMALSGDTVRRISTSFGSSDFRQMLADHRWNLILLSAGGNDLIDALTEDLSYIVDGTTLSIIQTAADNGDADSYINHDHLNLLLAFLKEKYDDLFDYIRGTINSAVPIVIHTYDYPTARNAPAKVFVLKKGPWLLEAFKKKAVPKKYWNEITDFIFESLANTLLSLNEGNVHVVKTHGTLLRADSVEGSDKDWLNEIHPNAKGLEKLAIKINDKIRQVIT